LVEGLSGQPEMYKWRLEWFGTEKGTYLTIDALALAALRRVDLQRGQPLEFLALYLVVLGLAHSPVVLDHDLFLSLARGPFRARMNLRLTWSQVSASQELPSQVFQGIMEVKAQLYQNLPGVKMRFLLASDLFHPRNAGELYRAALQGHIKTFE
jgi:hypothetical protein